MHKEENTDGSDWSTTSRRISIACEVVIMLCCFYYFLLFYRTVTIHGKINKN
jgi:hypothetical protein